MRLFIAVNFDMETRNRLVVQDRLRAAASGTFTRGCINIGLWVKLTNRITSQKGCRHTR